MTARCTLTSWDSVPDAVRETRNHDNRMAELDARDEYADMLLALDDEVPEPLDPLALPGLLASPCLPTRENTPEPDERCVVCGEPATTTTTVTVPAPVCPKHIPDPLADLEHRLPNVSMERDEAMALRARISRKDAV